MKVQLSILVENAHTGWADKLPSIRYAMNSSTSQSTGHTPAYLSFAREMRSPGDIQRDLREIVIGKFHIRGHPISNENRRDHERSYRGSRT